MRRHQQGHAAGLAELQRGARILVDEGLLDRRLVRRIGGEDRLRAVLQLDQPVGQRAAFASELDAAVGDMREPLPLALDDAPAGTAQARIDADDANGCPMP